MVDLTAKPGWALWCVSQGWHIFPCDPTHKTPKWKWSERTATGVDDTLAWWSNHPEDNIAVACKPSGLVVLDLDVGHATKQVLGQPFTNGTRALQHILNRLSQPWPDTLEVATPSGGRHLYFRAPSDLVIPNRPLLGAAGLIDVRAAGGEYGGYVLGPGSTDTNGRMYIPGTGFAPTAHVAPLPQYLMSMLREQPKPAKAPPSKYAQPDGHWDYLAESLRDAPQGNRNNMLYWAAATMFEEGATLEQVESLLLPCVPDLDESAGRTIQSAQRKAT